MYFMQMHYIYVIKNCADGKSYVGQTRNFSQRKAGHLFSAKKGDTRPLYCAIRQFGVENFEFHVLEECTNESLASEREKFWVDYFDSFNSGYNLTNGGGYHVGNKGRKFSDEHKKKLSELHKGKPKSPEHRQKISESHKGNTHRRGKQLTAEQKAHQSEVKNELYASERGQKIKKKISETLMGRSLSEEHKTKISSAGKGRKHSSETIEKMKAHKFSDEHRQKLSEAAKKRYLSKESE